MVHWIAGKDLHALCQLWGIRRVGWEFFSTLRSFLLPTQHCPPIPTTDYLISLRCLRFPLQTLSVNDFQFAESDSKHLSQCSITCQLKHLNLSGVTLTCFSPEPLKF
jgi:hypothetical protein